MLNINDMSSSEKETKHLSPVKLHLKSCQPITSSVEEVVQEDSEPTANILPLVTPTNNTFTEDQSINGEEQNYEGSLHSTLNSQFKSLNGKLECGDSYLGFLRNKKSMMDVPQDLKLKKPTPSTINLRDVAPKGSTRAEFFAAKLHDAIKDDEADGDETFVYDTTNNGTINNEEVEFSIRNKDKDKDKDKEDLTIPVMSNEQNNLQEIQSDTFDVYSRTSLNSKGVTTTSLRKASKDSASASASTAFDANHPISKAESCKDEVNRLRQITSRLFDLKGVQPRRYSDDEDFEDVGPATNIIYSIDENDSFEDQLSDYFKTRQNYAIQPDKYTDYGSIPELQNHLHKNSKLRKRLGIYNSPHDFTSLRIRRLKQLRNFCYIIMGIIFLISLGFISGFILATNKELQNVDVVSIQDIIVSQEELIFDLVFEAFNPGLLEISIENVQLDIFAKSEWVDPTFDSSLHIDNKNSGIDTILLGAIDHLEMPLIFEGGFLSRHIDSSLTEIKIVNPCSFDDFNKTVGILKPDEKWLNISRNPFDLIVRGAMIYKLPLSLQNHTVSVNYSHRISNTDTILAG